MFFNSFFRYFLYLTGTKFILAPTLQAAKNGGKLHTEYKELTEKKDKLYQEYGKLKKKVKQYDMIKQNVDSILRQAKQPERDRQTER